MAEDGREESVAADDDSQHTAEDGRNGLNNTMVEESPTLLRRMEICVAEAEKRSGKNAVNMQETFTVYLIETRPMDALAEGRNPAPDSLWRRYSEFELLRNYLLVSFPYIVVPPLPEKRAEFVWHKLSADNMDPDFVERRRVGLENFLLRVASHPVLSNDKILHHFLTEEHGWKEVVYETGFQAKADSRLKALSATFRPTNPLDQRCPVLVINPFVLDLLLLFGLAGVKLLHLLLDHHGGHRRTHHPTVDPENLRISKVVVSNRLTHPLDTVFNFSPVHPFLAASALPCGQLLSSRERFASRTKSLAVHSLPGEDVSQRFMDMKHYSDELQSHTSQLLRARARVADRLYGVYKVHGNYGRVFSEWSAIEREMGDGLQSAGHHMDAYAASIDDILEEEEHYADQLKEYLFYAEALRAVCRKHELTQFELEMATQDLISKKQQHEELSTGIVRTFSFKGMTNKLFGQEAPEQREARLKLLEELIEEGEEAVKDKTVECE
ncbi:hypothetical protein JOQ06_003657 [Pogonophryne albipinna]|uniref:PX domain-containing protein n=1 Tax=Pogonophryne albipinna TaxID=1090488 RepID=A0AAD6F8L4_9TELE|nr:hypothetical protein JOQ06_003657 [Pogonophryne albipinna]